MTAFNWNLDITLEKWRTPPPLEDSRTKSKSRNVNVTLIKEHYLYRFCKKKLLIEIETTMSKCAHIQHLQVILQVDCLAHQNRDQGAH